MYNISLPFWAHFEVNLLVQTGAPRKFLNNKYQFVDVNKLKVTFELNQLVIQYTKLILTRTECCQLIPRKRISLILISVLQARKLGWQF